MEQAHVGGHQRVAQPRDHAWHAEARKVLYRVASSFVLVPVFAVGISVLSQVHSDDEFPAQTLSISSARKERCCHSYDKTMFRYMLLSSANHSIEENDFTSNYYCIVATGAFPYAISPGVS